MGNEESICLECLNIIVAGKNGAGKKTLINSIFKKELVQTGLKGPILKHIKKFPKESSTITIYDTPDFNVNTNEQNKLKQEIQNLIKEQSKTNDTNKYIHCLWYCIDSNSKSFDSNEKQFINSISNIPVIIVLTRSDYENATSQMMIKIESEKMKIRYIVPILAQDTIFVNSFGIDQLFHFTLKSLPSNYDILKLNSYFKFDDTNKKPNHPNKINIIVTGKPGAGKSTLINAILKEDLAQEGIGLPITQKIQDYSNDDIPFVLFDTPGIEGDKNQQIENKKNIINLIKERSKAKDINQIIHCIWYCVQSESSRFEDDEEEFINQISKKVGSMQSTIPVFIVITKSYYTDSAEKIRAYIEGKIDGKKTNIQKIISVISKDKLLMKSDSEFLCKSSGVEELLCATKELLSYDNPEMLKIVEDIKKKSDMKEKELRKINIIVAGKTGAGKSTLINSFFNGNLAATGIGNPITQNITPFSKPGNPVTIYDAPGFELDSKQQKRIKNEIFNLIKNGAKTKDVNQCIHFIWYCINAQTDRYEKGEIEFIKQLVEGAKVCKVPVIIILTKSYSLTDGVELKNQIDQYDLGVLKVIPVVSSTKTFSDFTIEPYGLDVLEDVMEKNIDDSLKETFINVQKVSINKKREYAIAAVSVAVAGALASGASPIPFSDCFILAGIEATMLVSITAIYGVEVPHGFISVILSSTIGCGTATLLGRFAVVNILKCIPVVGSIVGGVISGATATVLTAALGSAYMAIMEAILNGEFDPNQISKERIKAYIEPIFKMKLKEEEEKVMEEQKIKEESDEKNGNIKSKYEKRK